MKRHINWLKDVMPVIKKRLDLWASQQITPTLRGLFYTLVSLNILENTISKYDYLSDFTSRAREKSEIKFEIRYKYGYESGHTNRHRTREYEYRYMEEEILPIDCFADNVRRIIDIDDIYETADEFVKRYLDYGTKFDNFKVPRWYKQPHYVEVWIEKDAMAGTLNSIINKAGEREVRIVPTRGQESVTFAWKNVQRLKQKRYAHNKKIHIRYFGDLDPSGEAIERELVEKLTRPPYGMYDIDFKRIGVTDKQRLDFRLVPNKDPKTMKKLKQDPNRKRFMEEHNLESENDLFQIEVDALEAIAPEQFKDMVLACVDEFFDDDIHQANLDDNEITPTEEDFKKAAIEETADLLACLENTDTDEEGDEDE